MTQRLVMLGDGGVGKSCLTVQLCYGFFTPEYDPTIVDEDTVLLEILDTAGQEDYAAMRDQHIFQGEAFALVYSITNRQSFEMLPELHRSILLVKEEFDQYPCVVIGNKVDLEKSRVVSRSEGSEFAKKINAPFFETSAQTRVNVEEAFESLVRELRKWKKKYAENDSSNKNGKKKGEKPKGGSRCVLQ